MVDAANFCTFQVFLSSSYKPTSNPQQRVHWRVAFAFVLWSDMSIGFEIMLQDMWSSLKQAGGQTTDQGGKEIDFSKNDQPCQMMNSQTRGSLVCCYMLHNHDTYE